MSPDGKQRQGGCPTTMADHLCGQAEGVHAFGQLSILFEAVNADLPPVTNMSDTEYHDGGRDDVYCGDWSANIMIARLKEERPQCSRMHKCERQAYKSMDLKTDEEARGAWDMQILIKHKSIPYVSPVSRSVFFLIRQLLRLFSSEFDVGPFNTHS